MSSKNELVISPWSVVTTVLILASFYLVYFIRDIIALFLIVLILAATFRPVVNRWEKKIKRLPAVLALLLILIAIISLLVYVMFPPLIHQFKALVVAAPDFINRIDFLQSYRSMLIDNIRTITQNPGQFSSKFVSITAGVFGGIFSFITVIVLTVYLLLEKNSFYVLAKNLLPSYQQDTLSVAAKKIAGKVGNWFRGQMLLSLIIGVIYFIVLSVLSIPYALPLAVIGALLEIVPTVGPIVAGAIAVLVALTVSPVIALIAAILFVVVQQVENSYLVPKIMQKAVGLSPVIVILAILVGAKLLGIVGAILTVPVVAALSVVAADWHVIRKSFKHNENRTSE